MRTARATLLLLSVTLGGFSVSACASDTSDYSSSNSSSSSSSSSSSGSDAKVAAIEALQRRDPSFKSYSDSDLQTMANGICAAFDQGMTLNEATDYATNSGLDYTQAGYMLGFAIAGTCPEHRGAVS